MRDLRVGEDPARLRDLPGARGQRTYVLHAHTQDDVSPDRNVKKFTQ